MKDITININGSPYRISTLDARQSQELLDHAKRLTPCPVAALMETANILPEDFRKDFIKEHIGEAFKEKKAIGTYATLQDFIQTPEGAKKFIYLMFRKFQPHLSEDEALELGSQAIEDHGVQLFLDLQASATKVPLSEEDAERRYFPVEGKTSRRPKRRV